MNEAMTAQRAAAEGPEKGQTSAGPADALARLLDERRLVLFDGVCVLCSIFVRFVLRHERAPGLTFVSMQSPLGQAVLAHFGLPLTGWDSFILVQRGQPLFKSSGFARIAEDLKAPWSWLRWIRVIPRPLRDWGYDRVARNRYGLFGRHDRCMLPDPAVAARFMDTV